MMAFQLLLTAAPVALALTLPDDVGRLPALGWNSWNAYGCDITADLIVQAAQDLVSGGYQAAGYEYVGIDDCWSSGRDSTTGALIPDANKFPNGISGVAEQVHALGLKLGIYSSAGTKTCAGYPASLYYEDIDAATWAAWGVDYLKYDNCNVPSNWTDACASCVPVCNACGSDYPWDVATTYGPNGTCSGESGLCASDYDYEDSNSAERYRRMGDALSQQNRTILYSLCSWGTAAVQIWGSTIGSSWRTTGDIAPEFWRVLEILNANSFITNYGDFYGHNDADLLEVGNGNLTYQETRTHFALWAMMKSPLLIGTDLGSISSENAAILLNPYLLAFNQDTQYGIGAAPYSWGVNPDYTYNATNPAQYWSGSSTNGTMVAMINTLDSAETMTADFSEIPNLTAGGTYEIIDVWTGESLGSITGSYIMSCMKLREELDHALADICDSAEVSVPYDMVKHLPYLKACLDEALRLHPPTPQNLTRTPPEGGALILGEHIPAGVTVGMAALVAHRDEGVFPQADKFIPERWLGEEGKNLQPYFLAFSAGARGCIGRNISYLEQTVLLASLLRRYDFALLSPDWELDRLETFNWILGEMPVKVWRRTTPE